MLKSLYSLNNIHNNFYLYLKDLSNRKLFYVVMLSGLITGCILGIITSIERIASYGLDLSFSNKILYILFSISTLTIAGLIVSLFEFCIISVITYFFVKLSEWSKIEEKKTSHLFLIFYSLFLSIITTFVLYYIFIIDPSAALMDFLNLGTKLVIVIYFFNVLIILTSIAGIFNLILKTSKKKGGPEFKPNKKLIITGIIIVTILIICYYSGLISFLLINLLLFLLVFYLITNYLIIYILDVFRKNKFLLPLISTLTGILFFITYFLSQNFLPHQLFIRFRVSLVIIFLVLLSFIFLHLTVFMIMKYFSIFNNESTFNNKVLITILATLLIIFAISHYSFNSGNVLKAFAYRYDVFEKITLCCSKIFITSKNMKTIPPETAENNLKQFLLPELPNKKPDVFIIVVDALRFDIAQKYLNKPDNAIGNFAKNSYNFLNSYSNSTTTVSSVPSALTSKYQSSYYDTGYITLAQIFKQKGYTTFNINDFPVLKADTKKKNFIPVHLKGFDIVNTLGLTEMVQDKKNDSLIAKRTIEFLDNYNTKKPLFAYIHFNQLHLIPPSIVFKNIFSNDNFVKDYEKAYKKENKNLLKLLEKIKEKGLYEDSIIIITADHGEAVKEHGDFFHAFTVYQELIHIPLFIKFPDQHFSKNIENPVSLLDIAPTILDYFNFDYKKLEPDGKSLLPVLNNKEEHNNPVYSSIYLFKAPLSFEYSLYGSDYCRNKSIFEVSIIDKSNRWKYIENYFYGFKELYDLSKDPGERKNLIDSNKQIPEKLLKNYKFK